MANKQQIPPQYSMDSKWVASACLNLTGYHLVYYSLTGAGAGLLLFRSPVARRAALSIGAGIGVGSAYRERNTIFGGFSAKSTSTTDNSPSKSHPTVAESPVSQAKDRE